MMNQKLYKINSLLKNPKKLDKLVSDRLTVLLQQQKDSSKEFISDIEIDNLIDKVLNNFKNEIEIMSNINEKTDAIIVKNPSIQIVPDMFKVIHRQYATDHYEYGSTIVKANSKKEAFEILNKYLETKPHGAYTALPCENIDDVYELHVLSY